MQPRRVLRVAASLAYPVVILCVWRWVSPRYVGALLFALLWLQRWAGTGALAASLRKLSRVDWTVAGVLSCASAAVVLTDSEQLMRLYPSLVNLGLLAVFGATLVKGPTMIEKFARISRPDPAPHIIRYTRRVTQIWCVFFAANTVFSVYTALNWSREAWSLYNGAVAYVLCGTLLIGEFAWRKCVMEPRAARQGIA
ncbi:membrane protein of unknown function [Pararobbsia alpina]|uniref:COG4648 family protein n=1 Tax=Pararobbsia alpina TaxID=621374 RepID=UPI0039A6927E